MEIILSTQCESLQGTLDAGLGYFIVKRGKRFYSQRSRHSVPPNGHWRFIVTCAQLAQTKLYIEQIHVSKQEVDEARIEAGMKPIAYCMPGDELDASDVLYIIKHFTR